MGGKRTADEVFALLSNEIRVDVLEAFARAQHEERLAAQGITVLSFSDVYERVDVDNTAKLSYHLGELTGTFLRRHEGGYAFTHAGERLVRFILAENYRQPSEFDPIETDGGCLYCDSTTLEAALDEQYFVVRCGACDRPVTAYIVTPAQTRSHDGAALLESIRRKMAAEHGLLRQGVCPECAGRVTTTVLSTDDVPASDDVPVSFIAVDECRQCLRVYSGPLVYSVAYHPASVAFHWEHGVDVTGTGWWELHGYLREEDWTAERVDTDPEEYLIALRQDEATLRVVLDAETRVTHTERVRGGPVG